MHDVLEDDEAAGMTDIQLTYEAAMARVAEISQGWDRLSRQVLGLEPRSSAEPRDVSGAATPQAA